MGLSERELKVLYFVVDDYIRNGEPVASASVARSGIVEVSPATIRNVMGELEDSGFLAQPHTSAGRIPTAAGMRRYVDHVREEQTRRQLRIDEETSHRFEGLDDDDVVEVARTASNLLSQVSSMAGLVLGPRLQRVRLKDLRLIPLSATRVLVVLVTSDSRAVEHVVHLEEPVDGVVLTKMQNYLLELGEGLTIAELRERVRAELAEAHAEYRTYMKHALAIGEQLASQPEVDQLHVEGALNMLEFNEVAGNIERARVLLRALEEKERVVEILDKVYNARTPIAVIGPELEWEVGDDLSLVVCGYYRGSEQVGLVGVLGPMRMDYARLMPLVDHAARVLSKQVDEQTD